MKAKIFVATHLDTVRPSDPLFETIQVGAAVSNLFIPGLSCDNDYTDNISYKNKTYSELTMLYDVLKNRCDDLDIVGTAHYRRTFCHNNVLTTGYEYGKSSRPTVDFTQEVFDKVFDSQTYERSFSKLKSGLTDVVTLTPFFKSSKYALFTFADLGWIQGNTVIAFYDYIEKTQNRRLSDYIKYWTLENQEHYCNNMFYARTETFKEYVDWLMTTLIGFEEHLHALSFNKEKQYITPRMFGYFSEYLMRPYFEYKAYTVEYVNSICFNNMKTDNRI